MMWSIKCSTVGCSFEMRTSSDDIVEFLRSHISQTGHRFFNVGLRDPKPPAREATFAEIVLGIEEVPA